MGRAWLTALGVVLALVAFELVLQVGAYLHWRHGGRVSSVPATDGPVILCVGDSFTRGLYASSPAHSYPTRLEDRLHAAGSTCTVVNAGRPGQTSRDVLERLPGQLRAFAPKLVYVLVGTNDRWSHPDLLPAGAEYVADDEEGFPLRWRTGILVKLLVHWLETGGEPEMPAFVGRWHQDEVEVTFEPDGRLVVGQIELRWSLQDGALRIRLPDGRVHPADWRCGDGTLRLDITGWPHPFVLQSGPPGDSDALARAEHALADGDAAAAEQGFRSCLETGAAVTAHLGLVRALAAQDQRERARPALDWLRERASADGDAEPTGEARTAAEALAQACVAVGEDDEALQVVCAIVRRDPARRWAWDALLRIDLDASRRRVVLAALNDILADAQLAGTIRAHVLRIRAIVLLPVDRDAALQSTLQGVLADGDDSFLREQVRTGTFTGAQVAQAIGALHLPADRSAELQKVLDGVTAGKEAGMPVLHAHLRRIVACCRAAHAEPVLMTYPARGGGSDADAQVEAEIRRAADDAGAPLIDVAPRFDELLRSAPREAFFVADGHCNDRGYDEIAALVAADARRRLR